MLSNALIQPHFDYACSSWYPNLNEKQKKKENTNRTNECISFCLKLGKTHHVFNKEFQSTNWLPVDKKVQQCINAITLEFVNNAFPCYFHKVYQYAPLIVE